MIKLLFAYKIIKMKERFNKNVPSGISPIIKFATFNFRFVKTIYMFYEEKIKNYYVSS